MRRFVEKLAVLWLSLAPVCVAQQNATPGQAPAPAASQQTETDKAPKEEAAPVPAPASPAAGTLPAAPRNGKKRRKPAPSVVPAPAEGPKKTVVREGGAKEPAAQIAPGLSEEEAIRQRQNAEQLLNATDDQLRMLAGRTLDLQQKETVSQIHNYMDGARQAFREGDVRRANMLAEKAHLLAEDLARH